MRLNDFGKFLIGCVLALGLALWGISAHSSPTCQAECSNFCTNFPNGPGCPNIANGFYWDGGSGCNRYCAPFGGEDCPQPGNNMAWGE